MTETVENGKTVWKGKPFPSSMESYVNGHGVIVETGSRSDGSQYVKYSKKEYKRVFESVREKYGL